MHKVCTICNRLLPLENFVKNKRTPDGYGSNCKECRAEYNRAYRLRPEAIKRKKELYPRKKRKVSDLESRFWAKVDKNGPNGCWLWLGARDDQGYGNFSVGTKEEGTRGMRKAHRISYELTYGEIPDDLLLCHHCDNPPCVNPEHLWPGTCADNVHDMIAKGRARYQKK